MHPEVSTELLREPAAVVRRNFVARADPCRQVEVSLRADASGSEDVVTGLVSGTAWSGASSDDSGRRKYDRRDEQGENDETVTHRVSLPWRHAAVGRALILPLPGRADNRAI